MEKESSRKREVKEPLCVMKTSLVDLSGPASKASLDFCSQISKAPANASCLQHWCPEAILFPVPPPWPWHWPCHCVWPTGWKRTWTKSLPTRADTALPLGIFLPPREQPSSRWLNDKKHVTLTSVMTQSTASNHSHSNLVWSWLGAIKLLHWAQVRTVTRINGGHFKPLYFRVCFEKVESWLREVGWWLKSVKCLLYKLEGLNSYIYLQSWVWWLASVISGLWSWRLASLGLAG